MAIEAAQQFNRSSALQVYLAIPHQYFGINPKETIGLRITRRQRKEELHHLGKMLGVSFKSTKNGKILPPLCHACLLFLLAFRGSINSVKKEKKNNKFVYEKFFCWQQKNERVASRTAVRQGKS